MWIGVVTLFPEMLRAVTDYGVTGRAIAQGRLQVNCWNPREFTEDRHRTVDDRPYGGGPGMLMKIDPLQKAIVAAKQSALARDGKTKSVPKVIYLSPQGKRLDQAGVNYLAELESMVLVAGRYEGVDERLIEAEVDEEWSIGDFVLSGGEIPAMALIDAVARMLPGTLGHEDSAIEDSFFSGLLDCPHYTRPEVFQDRQVPDVLLGGNHEKIRQWRLKQALGRTWGRRPDLLEHLTLTSEMKRLLDEYIREYSVVDE